VTRPVPEQLDLFGGSTREERPRASAELEPAEPDPRHVALAARLPEGLRLGTSSWSFPGWRGIVYASAATPARLARAGLRAYACHPLLRCVSLDRGYYAPIPCDDFARYADQVGEGFRFVVKAPEAATLARFPDHARYGASRGTQSTTFLDAAWVEDVLVGPACEGLAGKLGVILFQLPPQPAWALGGRERFAERLHRFLDALPLGPLYAVELRTERLLGEGYAQALAAAGAVHCLNVHPTMPPVDVQESVVGALERGAALVVRWMLGGAQRYEAARERYRPFGALVDEDPDARDAIAALCRAALGRGKPAFVVANNKAEGSAPLSVFRLAERIGRLP
jgi:uncharacterized protein YecE (DUF72 family)